jgi:ABC-type multidrug transport system fused ATPase/permease subunit
MADNAGYEDDEDEVTSFGASVVTRSTSFPSAPSATELAGGNPTAPSAAEMKNMDKMDAEKQKLAREEEEAAILERERMARLEEEALKVELELKSRDALDVQLDPPNHDKPKLVLSADDVAPVMEPEPEVDEEAERIKRQLRKKKINIFQLYRFAEPLDYLFLIVGLVGTLLQGFGMQYPFVLVGKVITQYTLAMDNCTNATTGAALPNSTCNFEQLLMKAAAYVSIDFAICGLLTCIGSYAHVALFTIVADRVTRKVRRLVFSNILRQHIGYFDVHFGGELNTRLTQDVTKFEVGIGSKVSLAVAWLMTFFFGMIFDLIMGWQLTLIMCLMLPIAALLSGLTGRIMKIYTEKEMTAYAKAGSVAEEALGNIKIVAAFAGEIKEGERYDKLLGDARKISMKSALASAFGTGVPFFLILTVTAITIYLAGYLVNEGKITSGFVMQLFASMMIGLRSLGYAAGALEIVSDSQGAAYGIYEIIDAKTLIDSTDPSGEKIEDLKGHILFEEIHFVYPARANVQILKGLTVEILPGQTAALVGPSGCGKSTTIQLIQRFYDPDQGTVYLDGKNVKDLNLTWLRRQIGVVSQEPVLFATTIEENIRFGNPEATLDEIIAAAKEADAHGFIDKLTDKYETLLNEQGTQLSRGEKQRISLARALVRQPKILLLDECTSALDNESEAAVQKALEKASKGRTTILIAHRLSTVRDSDVLFVVDKGVVAEKGTHDELFSRKQLYHKLVSTQMLASKEKQQQARDLETPKEVLVQIENRRRSSVAQRRMSMMSMKSTGSQNARMLTELRQAQGDAQVVGLTNRPMKRIFAMNKPELPHLLLGVIGGFLVGCVWPIFSILFSNVIGALVTPGDNLMQIVALNSWGLFGLGIVAMIITAISIFVLRYAGELLTERVRSQAYKAMLRQEVAWFDDPDHQVGSLTSKLANEASRIKMATGNTLFYLCAAVSAIILAIVIALASGWELGLTILPLMPLTILSGVIQGYMNTGYEMKSHQRTEESGRVASEAVDKVRTLASLTKEFYFLDKYMAFFEQMKKEARRRANIIGLSWAFYYFDGYVIDIVAFGFGLWLVSQGMMQFKMIFRVLVCTLMTFTDVGRANANVPELTSSKAAAYKVLQLMDRMSEIDPFDPNGKTPSECRGEVALKGVTYYYPTRQNTLVLRDFSIAANRGQCIAVVGPSGGGKSTIVQLLERFYDVFSGVVSVDGIDVKDMNLKWLRAQMGIVTQEPILFAVSLHENIAYGDNTKVMTREEVIKAARSANIHDFITTLPLGYDTNIGSKGSQLSGGQKQRVSIARALVRNPKILLLDDATSALDSHSESIVEEALNKARAGRTSIIISHRLSSIIGADTIVYIDHGKVLEKGTHGELMALKKHYYQLQLANQGGHK